MPPQPNNLPENKQPPELNPSPDTTPTETVNPIPTMPPPLQPLSQAPIIPATPRKTSSKVPLLLLLLILVAAGAGLYFFIKRQSSPPQAHSGSNAANQTQPVGKKLYFQNYTKVVAYDLATKQKQTLTDKLPPDSTVLDLYADDSTWRLYYFQTPVYQGNEAYRVTYLEKDKSSQEVVSVARTWIVVAANAEAKTVAYTEVFDPGGSGASQTSRHYAIKDGTTTKVYESAPASQSRGTVSDLANIGYVTDAVAPDGNKILYGYVGKFYSESPPSATKMQYDLTAKKTALIHEGGQGALDLLKDGSYMIREDEDVAWFGSVPARLKQKLYTLDKIGGKPRVALEISEPTWLGTVYSKDYTLLASLLKDPKDPQSFSGSFGQLYRIDHSSATKTQLELTNLPAGMDFTEISGQVDKCYGVVVRSSATSTSQPGYGATELGVLCLEGPNSANYSKLEAFDDQGKTIASFRTLN